LERKASRKLFLQLTAGHGKQSILPQQASGYHECVSAGMAASIAVTTTAIRVVEILLCRSLLLLERKLVEVFYYQLFSVRVGAE